MQAAFAAISKGAQELGFPVTPSDFRFPVTPSDFQIHELVQRDTA
jgi:hypothetical protein